MYWSSFILAGLKIRLGYRRCRGSQPHYVCFALSPGPSARSSFMNLYPSISGIRISEITTSGWKVLIVSKCMLGGLAGPYPSVGSVQNSLQQQTGVGVVVLPPRLLFRSTGCERCRLGGYFHFYPSKPYRMVLRLHLRAIRISINLREFCAEE